MFDLLPTPLLALVDTVARHLLPFLLVASLKTVEVLLQTFRTVFVVTGRRAPAAGIAAVEAAIVIAALGIVLTDITPARVLGFVAGVSLGTAAGMEAVFRLRLGIVTVRAFLSPGMAPVAAEAVRTLGHGVTTFDGQGRDGEVTMLLTAVRRRHAQDVVRAIESAAPAAFTTVDNAPAPGSVIGGVLGARV